MIDGTLVLAAGKSTRISAVSAGLPKPLIHLAGRPVISWNLKWLARSGIQKAWVNLHYRPIMVRVALGDGSKWGMQLRYSYESTILGTAGAWKKLANEWGRTTIVVYGDSLVMFDLSMLIRSHAYNDRALATIAVFHPAIHTHTNIAGSRLNISPTGLVEKFIEGDSSEDTDGFVNAGVYLLDIALLKRIPNGFVDFGRDIFPELAREGRLNAVLIEPTGYCIGIDTPEALEAVQKLLQEGHIKL